jgi:hypothetical protein
MLRIAADYERLAERAAQPTCGGPSEPEAQRPYALIGVAKAKTPALHCRASCNATRTLRNRYIDAA